MSGKSHFRSGVAALALLGALAWPAASAAMEELTLSHFVPSSHGMHRDFLVPWAKEVEECAQGEVKITLFPGGTNLGNVTKQQEQLLAGVVDIAHGLTGMPRAGFHAPRSSTCRSWCKAPMPQAARFGISTKAAIFIRNMTD